MRFRTNAMRVAVFLALAPWTATLTAHASAQDRDKPAAKKADRATTDDGKVDRGAARRARTPYCTSSVRFPAPAPKAETGVPTPPQPAPRVQLRYRAVPLSAETLAAIRENPRARAFYNGRVFRRLIQLRTDIPLEIGDKRIDAGGYDAGLECLGAGKWRFVIVDRAGRPVVEAPLLVTRAETPIPCLNLSLIPLGETTLAIAVRYGTRRGTILAKGAVDTTRKAQS